MNLKPLSFLCLACEILFVYPAACSAQNPPSYEQLLRDRRVQAELELSREQMLKLGDAHREIADYAQSELRKYSVAPRADGEQPVSVEQAAEEIERAVFEFQDRVYSELLLDFQMKRLAELQVKYGGPDAVFDRRTREKLELTEEQFMEFKKRRTELLKSIEAAVERAHEEAVASGLPKERVVGLWAIMGLGPRKLDHALDYLPEEQVELVAGLKKSFDEVQQMRADVSERLIESLTPKQQRAFKKLQGD